jgi:prevent-host-death family protein
MSKTVNIREARTHLSKLVEQAAAGNEIIIAKNGKPVARLVPYAPTPQPKKFGLMNGCFKVPDDFDAPLDPQVLALFRDD